jgi:hypothetical protein
MDFLDASRTGSLAQCPHSEKKSLSADAFTVRTEIVMPEARKAANERGLLIDGKSVVASRI